MQSHPVHCEGMRVESEIRTANEQLIKGGLHFMRKLVNIVLMNGHQSTSTIFPQVKQMKTDFSELQSWGDGGNT